MQTVSGLHSERILHEFFKFEVPAYNIRRPNLNSKIQRASLNSRGTKHDDLFREKTPLPTNCAGFSQATFEQIQIAHQVRDLFLLSNEELIRFFFICFLSKLIFQSSNSDA